MRPWLFRQMSKPWVARVTLGVLFAVIMLGLRFGLHALLDGSSTGLKIGFTLTFFPALLAFGVWWDRKGY